MRYKKGRPVAIIDFVTARVQNLQIQVRLVFRNYVSCIAIPCPLVIIEIFLVNSLYRRIKQCGRLAFNKNVLKFQVYSLVYLLPLFTCLFFDC